MSRTRRQLYGLAGAGLGAAAAMVTAGLVVDRRVRRTRSSGVSDSDRLGGLRGETLTVTTPDGVDLHCEVDEVAPYSEDLPEPRRELFRRRPRQPPPATVVFVHGYALNLDCWHFQRQFLRGKRRMVFYDQRSHGRSTRAEADRATIEQLGEDLRQVIDELVPTGPVVLVGHSMGGMTIVALAEEHPELFGDRVVGVALVSTTAGGMRTHHLISRYVPDALGTQLTSRLIAGLTRAPEVVDGARRRGSTFGYLVTDRFAFGDDVPPSYVAFVDEMLAGTPFEVLAQFFPNFDALDKFSVLAAFERIPTLIVCGTKDLLTSIGHSRKMHARMPHSKLVECPGAGHMVILERKDDVNEALAGLLERAEASRVETAS